LRIYCNLTCRPKVIRLAIASIVAAYSMTVALILTVQ